MAVGRSDEERAEVARFVQLLFRLSGARNWAEFATIAGVHPVNLSGWQSGRSMPDGWNLYRLVRAAGAIEHISGPRATPGEDDPELVRELEELADLLERLQRLGSSIGRRASGA